MELKVSETVSETVKWRKSSRSGGTLQCVEVTSGVAWVRDSKNPGGPALRGTGLLALARAHGREVER